MNSLNIKTFLKITVDSDATVGFTNKNTPKYS